MPTLTIKGMPSAMYERLKKSAKRHRRSLNSEIIVCVERALGSYRLEPEDTLRRVARIRDSEKYRLLTDDVLEQARTAGRP